MQQPALGDTVFICSSFVLESVFVLVFFFFNVFALVVFLLLKMNAI